MPDEGVFSKRKSPTVAWRVENGLSSERRSSSHCTAVLPPFADGMRPTGLHSVGVRTTARSKAGQSCRPATLTVVRARIDLLNPNRRQTAKPIARTFRYYKRFERGNAQWRTATELSASDFVLEHAWQEGRWTSSDLGQNCSVTRSDPLAFLANCGRHETEFEPVVADAATRCTNGIFSQHETVTAAVLTKLYLTSSANVQKQKTQWKRITDLDFKL